MSINKLLGFIAIFTVFAFINTIKSPSYADHKVESCEEKVTIYTKIPEDRNNDGLNDTVSIQVCKAQWLLVSPQFFDIYCNSRTQTSTYIEKKKRNQIFRAPEIACHAT